MERTIKIELLEADIWPFAKDRSPPPDGIKIEGPFASQMCSPNAPKIAEYLLITVKYGGVFFAGVAQKMLAQKAQQWITDYLARHKAKRVRVNQRDANSETMAQVIREEIEIGKQD